MIRLLELPNQELDNWRLHIRKIHLTLPSNANIYAKEYKLYLPDKKLLQKKLKEWLEEEQN